MPQSERIRELAEKLSSHECLVDFVEAELHKALQPLLEAIAEEVNRWDMPKLKAEADKWK